MNKVTIKKIPFKLNGDIITKGSKIDFKAVNKENKDVFLKDIKKTIILSTFPDINTRVCDAQTQGIAKTAIKHKDIHFLSLTTDSVETINKGCAANNIDNIDIGSDKYNEFSTLTNTLIKKIKKLARGFIVIKNGEIIDISYNKEISSSPDFAIIEKYL